MIAHDIILPVFLALAIVYILWTLLRAKKWSRLQGEAIERQKLAIAGSERAEQRVQAALELQTKQVELTKELIAEIRALREDLKGKDA
jgi:hypothetical protein